MMKVPTKRRKKLPRRTKRAIYVLAFLSAWLYGDRKPVAQAPVIRMVFAAGTSAAGDLSYTNAQFQTALNDAVNDPCGSKILLQEGQTYAGTFVMRPLATTATWNCFTIATGVSATGTILPDTDFPAAGVRMTNGERGTVSYRSKLAKLQPTVNNQPSLRTAYPGETGPGCATAPCISHGYTVTRLEFVPNPNWYSSALVHFGTNKAGSDADMPGSNQQDLVSEVPNFLTFTQNDIHGDPLIGQHQGLRYSAGSGRVTLNSFADFKSLLETQAVTFVNWVGPVDLHNNLLEGTGENVMTGGGDSKMQQSATVLASPTPTSTSIGVSNTLEFYNGQWITVEHTGTQYSVKATDLTGSTMTLESALPFTPSVGDTVRWTRIGGGLSVRLNDFWKRPEWRDPIMAPPTNINVVCSNTGGTLAAGTYTYSVSARRTLFGNGGGSDASSAASAQDSDTVTSGATGSCTTTWTASVGDTAGSRVYGRAATATMYWSVADGVTTYTDTGTAGTTGSAPSTGSTWVVKNNFEMKHCEGGSPAGPCLIEGNRFAYTWCCAQNMNLNLKTWNQNGGDVSSTIRNLTVRYNWFIGGPRWVNLTATDAEFHPSGIMENVFIHNNLATQFGPAWGGTYTAILVNTGNYPNRAAGSRGARQVTIDHNSIFNDSTSQGSLWFNQASGHPTVDFQFKNNFSRVAQFGLRTYIDDQGQTIGTTSWNAATSGANRLATHNVHVGLSNATTYPDTPNNWNPTDAAFQAEFVNYATCQTTVTDPTPCALSSSSTYNNAGNDGLDIGADISAIKALTDIAIAGSAGGGGQQPAMPVQVGTPTNAGSSSAASLTWSHTNTGNYLRVGVATESDTRIVSGCAYNGVALTKLAHHSYAPETTRRTRNEYWYLVNPFIGTADISCSLSASAAVAAGGVSYDNVDTANPHGTHILSQGDSAMATATTPANGDQLVVDVTSIRTGTTGITVGPGQTQRVNRQSAAGVGNVTLNMSDEPGATNVTTTWSVNDATPKVWVVISVPLNGLEDGGVPAENDPPIVNAGSDAAVTLPSTASLDGTVSDDGNPNPPGSVTTTWSEISGPGDVTFGNASAVDTTAAFTTSGTYVLRLTASDSALSASDDVTVTVSASAGSLALTTTSPLPSAIASVAYNVTLTATGGTAPYTWSRPAGQWPTGLSMSSAGVISGTCTQIGTRAVTVRVTDAAKSTDEKVLIIACRQRRPLATIGNNERFIFSSTVEPSPANNRDVLAGDLWHDTGAGTFKWCKTSSAWSCTLWELIDAGGGGGATTLDGLTDVAITTPADDQFLRYNGTSWVNETVAIGGATTLNGLTDVTIASPATNQFLRFNGTEFVNQTVNVFTQGGNAYGATATFGTTDAQAINLIAEGITRLKTDATPTVKAVTLQANGNNNPELYVTQGDASDWMNMGFNAADGRRVVGQAGAGTFRSMFGLAGATTGTNYIFGIGSSANSGSTNTRWFGVRHDGVVTIRRLTLQSATRPTCDATLNADGVTFWATKGAAGVKDTVEVCAKDAGDAYAWRVIY